MGTLASRGVRAMWARKHPALSYEAFMANVTDKVAAIQPLTSVTTTNERYNH
jgi:hypothetical protein